MDILRRRLLENATKQSDFAEIFAAIDRDCSGRITFEEFRLAIKTLRLGIENNDEIRYLFRQFDTTNNGQIDFQEFLQQLKPPLNDRRRNAALNLFNSMDVDHDGKLTIYDLKTKFASQLTTQRQRSAQNLDLALVNFLKRFDTRGQEDGIIDQDEFLNFCSMLSATIREDIYFEHALRTLFNLRL